jgi:uncharacterized membrane protein (DUF2068 family)
VTVEPELPATTSAGVVEEHPHVQHPTKNERYGLELIAIYKFVKAGALVLAGLGALGLINRAVAAAANGWLESLALRQGHRLTTAFAAHALPYLGAATNRRLILIAIGAFLYSALYLVEGVGLWRCRRWAEYLTVGATASFLPIEIVALVHRVTLPRAVTLAFNVIAVVFLAWQLRVSSHSETA